MIYIGIDPGGSGGIAALVDGPYVLLAEKMPDTELEVLELLRRIVRRREVEGSMHAMIETVGVMPGQGISSAFTFGRNVGGLHMALASAGIPYDQVVPRKWQAAMQCLTGGDKNVSKRRAQQLYPHEKVTHAIADALLIAEYCRRMMRGIVGQKASEHGKEEGGALGAPQGGVSRDPKGGRASCDEPITEIRALRGQDHEAYERKRAIAGAPGNGGRPDQAAGQPGRRHRGDALAHGRAPRR